MLFLLQTPSWTLAIGLPCRRARSSCHCRCSASFWSGVRRSSQNPRAYRLVLLTSHSTSRRTCRLCCQPSRYVTLNVTLLEHRTKHVGGCYRCGATGCCVTRQCGTRRPRVQTSAWGECISLSCSSKRTHANNWAINRPYASKLRRGRRTALDNEITFFFSCDQIPYLYIKFTFSIFMFKTVIYVLVTRKFMIMFVKKNTTFVIHVKMRVTIFT